MNEPLVQNKSSWEYHKCGCINPTCTANRKDDTECALEMPNIHILSVLVILCLHIDKLHSAGYLCSSLLRYAYRGVQLKKKQPSISM